MVGFIHEHEIGGGTFAPQESLYRADLRGTIRRRLTASEDDSGIYANGCQCLNGLVHEFAAVQNEDDFEAQRDRFTDECRCNDCLARAGRQNEDRPLAPCAGFAQIRNGRCLVFPQVRRCYDVHATFSYAPARAATHFGIPNVVVEAQAASLPVVCTPLPALPELIEDGTSGLYVDEDDADGLARTLRSLFADPAWRRRLAAEGLRRVAARFDITETAATLASLFATPGRKLREMAG